MKRIASVALLLLWSLPLWALTPKEIVIKADQLDDGETSISELTMTLIDDKGQKRIRQMKGYRKDYPGETKSINFFMSPADVRNTALLSYDYDDDAKDDDNWLFLPALRKVKRIASGNKKDSFMGSDFSYHDMNGLKIEDWDYSMVKESEMVEGNDCWVIGSVPKKEVEKEVLRDTEYAKRLAWIRKDNYVVIRGKVWLTKGGRVKMLQARGVKQVQGIWTISELEMSTLDRQGAVEHSTILKFDNIKYNEGVENNLFTTQRMEQGL